MKKSWILNCVIFFSAAIIATIGAFYSHEAWAEGVQSIPPSAVGISSFDKAMGYWAAAIAVGLSCLGAGIAVSHVGSAAMGALSEKPELTGRALIFVGLAEGIAIYGLIVAIMILGRLV
jgi:V/A-type H+/Na+-transporting ATPase subunit K